ncbi:MAG: hypothetical protein H8E84_05255 [Flavobacteriales bacterium]|nr:hypothetical protein [Flavobacteriales bacterium]
MKHFGKIKNLKIDLLDEERFIEDLLKFEGKNIVILISENKDYRTNSQNKLWWKYMEILGGELGYIKNEMHDIAKLKFLERERIENGVKIKYLKSTTSLTKKEFKDLVDAVVIWAASTFSINLPNE